MSTQRSIVSKVTKALCFAAAALACTPALGRSTAPEGRPSTRACPSTVVQGQEEAYRLQGCTTVRGDLTIEKTALESLNGFGSLEAVTGTLRIADNPKLESLEGLERLRRVRSLVVNNNPELESLEALRSLRSARDVLVHESPRLETFRGLERVRSLRSLIVSRVGIYSTVGLDGVREVGNLAFVDNPRLISLRGLKALRNASSIRITGNNRLAPEQGFLAALERVPGPFVIEGNASLSAADVESMEARARGRVSVAAR